MTKLGMACHMSIQGVSSMSPVVGWHPVINVVTRAQPVYATPVM